MRRLAKQFQLSGQHRDTHIRLSAREVRLKCVSFISSFRQSLKRCSLLGSHWRVGSHLVQFFYGPIGGGERRGGGGVRDAKVVWFSWGWARAEGGWMAL